MTQTPASELYLRVSFSVQVDEVDPSILDLSHPMGVTDAAFLDSDNTLLTLAQNATDISFEFEK